MKKIVMYPSKILSKKCSKVKIGDTNVLKVLDEMYDAMYISNGVGLAGPQYGISKRIVVVDIRDEPQKVYKMINPEITWRSEELVHSDEGCLSLPGVHGIVVRNFSVSVTYYDENYNLRKVENAEPPLSVCFQHEIDHLDGILYIDRMDEEERVNVLREYQKLKLTRANRRSKSSTDSKSTANFEKRV